MSVVKPRAISWKLRAPLGALNSLTGAVCARRETAPYMLTATFAVISKDGTSVAREKAAGAAKVPSCAVAVGKVADSLSFTWRFATSFGAAAAWPRSCPAAAEQKAAPLLAPKYSTTANAANLRSAPPAFAMIACP